ncbi:hypothetical protein F1188_07825 [Roseospira marina]|uniref:DUF1624 domain-containing protein n=1 Tax=Roseospira marina TaxID=140057 RepID=A0A5M6IDH7_9PROT|nr:OpgC domain-containing protein [Roseospira marina]KAA5606316.1 hypothetical protein F1188_07825 [Roseospira marina]MBB4314478.1 hypothetical protein [Roseospira marina]MBB5087638.1 hypothetical protein [Roseospira marina]
MRKTGGSSRLEILDGFRGYFLIFMMIVHTDMDFDTLIGKLNHHSFGWVEDAQGFVFISGVVVGLVYGGRLLRRGFPTCVRAVFKRIATIYSHQAGLILIFLASTLAFVTVVGPLPAGRYLAPVAADPLTTTVSSLLLVSGTANMGILPMYIWFMVLTPFALWMIHRGRGLAVLAIMVCTWILGQTGVAGYVIGLAEQALSTPGHAVTFGIFFNLLGWQVVYFSGLFFGYLYTVGRLNLDTLRDPQWYTVFKIGVGMVVFLGILDRLVWGQYFGPEFSAWFLEKTSRRDFTSIYLFAFMLDVFLITWLLVAGKTCTNRPVAALAMLVEWIFTRRFLVFLGQHSLHVFSMHMLLLYALNTSGLAETLSPALKNIVVVLSPLPLYLAAAGHAWVQQQDVRKTQRSQAIGSQSSA